MPVYEVCREQKIKTGGEYKSIGDIVDESIFSPRMLDIYLKDGSLKKIFTKEDMKKIMVPYLDQNKEEHLLELTEEQIQNIFRILQANVKDEKFQDLLKLIKDSDMLTVLAITDIRKTAQPFYKDYAQRLGV